MFSFWKSQSRRARILSLAPIAAGLLLAAGAARAGGPPWGVPSGSLPWERPGYQGYSEPTKPVTPAPPMVAAMPEKYTIAVTMLPQRVPADENNPNIAVVMAHLPEHAQIWFEDQPTKSTGMVRYFESPPLAPGKRYSYTARIVWHEAGKWVSETTKVPVRAGEIHCIYLTQAGADKQAKIAANLAKLSPEDRKLTESQKFCAIQEDNRLGAMGVPVKVMVKDQPVFLCCKGCKEAALENPDKTLAKVRELKAKNARTPPK